MKEAFLLVVKPDGMVKGLAGTVLTRFEATGLKLVAARVVRVTRELAEEHYRHLKSEPCFNDLICFLKGDLHNRQDTVLAMIFCGEDAVRKGRELAGATNPEQADPRSVRGSLGRVTTRGVFENVIHVSSNSQEGEREIKLWFSPEDLAFDLFPVRQEDNRKVWG